MLIDYDIYYAAGFWEGEGSCGCYSASRGNSKRLVASVTQYDEIPLLWFKNNFSGCICAKTQWQIGGDKAKDFLELIYPIIKSNYKRGQVEKALAAWSAYRAKIFNIRGITKRKRKEGFGYILRMTIDGDIKSIGTFDSRQEAIDKREEVKNEM